LLSIATAQFEGRDAREEIHGLVDDLNETKPGFKFTKDLVLKAGLVLTDISDVGFIVENFTAANMKKLDEAWDEIERALRIGVKLLGSFGFSESSLPANSVLIPIVDYVHNRQLDESYVTSANSSVKADREALRNWTIRTILRRASGAARSTNSSRASTSRSRSRPGRSQSTRSRPRWLAVGRRSRSTMC
jgi:hypothetical protein